ncbi:MAG: hypothetical protein C0408_01705, partial [Odoribacter sp.]|nr:hypothetical protein [Odoribacter sp.]
MLIITCNIPVTAQDSIKVPLHIRAGLDIVGPVSYFADRNNLTLEGFVVLERDSKKSYVFEAGYQNFSYSQYNYSYLSKGVFLRCGIDFNLLQPIIT